ncbi:MULTISPECIES: hypothetical protein [unclassified Rathayibacter]|uniref:hypothetical protein n=1 Tax=unclassified Rathayibacter TaxID=2609250 RepID=UPI0006F1E8CB|nr:MULTISPECIES: hypothetical protein [unclassified Rathayibacter]KQQ03395.1 hypothetical protein ASF42_07670 [Rathayibacter sp. Leaf294]KQS11850.1 hypothetical protein ASG06_07670 [Rathayibacter sp. Leaf185]
MGSFQTGSSFDSTAYFYPWDVVGDPAAARRIARSGVSSVTLAAAYHSVRAATPRHPGHRVVEARTAALYVPVRERAWAGQRLTPGDGAAWAGHDSFARARDALAQAGLASQAWLALTHADGIAAGGTSSPVAPDLCTTNAFGDVYIYSLCPSSEEVRQYAATLTSECVALAGVDSVILEAVGPMGFGHLSAHEKTAGADYGPLEEALLSVCFCAACCSAYDERGGADALRQSVREALSRAPDTSATLDDGLRGALGDTTADVLLETRRSASLELRTAVLDAARSAGASRVTLHCSSEVWATGPFGALLDDARDLDGVVAAAWAQGSESVAEVSRLAGAAHPSLAIGAYCTVLPPTPIDVQQTVRHWSALLEAGATELHLYHAGLASDARLGLLEAALDQVEATDSTRTPTAPSPLSKEPSHD